MAADLTIRVVGLRSGAGDVHYAVYDKAEGFPTYEGRIAKGHVPADVGGTVMRVTGLKPGTYAVAVFHDENRNGTFDRGFLGIPLEDYGFSNNASGFLGPPSFEAAAFALDEPQTQIVIDLAR